MKKFIILFISVILFTSCNPYYNKKNKYCGLVVDKFCSQTEGKYPSTKPHIVIDCVTKKTKIVKEVSWTEYVNTNTGDYKCYELTQFEIDHY